MTIGLKRCERRYWRYQIVISCYQFDSLRGRTMTQSLRFFKAYSDNGRLESSLQKELKGYSVILYNSEEAKNRVTSNARTISIYPIRKVSTKNPFGENTFVAIVKGMKATHSPIGISNTYIMDKLDAALLSAAGEIAEITDNLKNSITNCIAQELPPELSKKVTKNQQVLSTRAATIKIDKMVKLSAKVNAGKRQIGSFFERDLSNSAADSIPLSVQSIIDEFNLIKPDSAKEFVKTTINNCINMTSKLDSSLAPSKKTIIKSFKTIETDFNKNSKSTIAVKITLADAIAEIRKELDNCIKFITQLWSPKNDTPVPTLTPGS